MAISGGDGSIILTTKVDQTGLKKGLGSIKKLGATAGKAFLAIGAAAGAATVAITKMAVSAYADYEQLVGGVETLFKGSAQKVIDYANDAFYTAGVSANEYMKQVTSFSASLIRSTAGDTDKAADIANMALIDISDNVNKMGSSMESVTLAYQGFAKQQYMLLDNLKLGYGGTKTEMERLLKDAQALTGVKYDINNLADVYSAIHAIQEELGITGTTAKEAEKTITGSANMMKAAWQNVLSAIAGGGDLDRAINNLVYSIQKYFENIVPVVQRSLVGIGRLIEKVAPMLIQNVASALIQSIPSLINAIYQMIIGLAKGIYEGIKALFTGSSGTITADIKTSVDGVSSSLGGATEGMENLGDATEQAGKQAKKSLAAFDDLNIITSGLGGESTGDLDIPMTNVGGLVTDTTMDIKTEEKDQLPPWLTERLNELKEAFSGLKDIDLTNLNKSLGDLWDKLKGLGEVSWDIILWGIETVIVPLTKFTVEDVLPNFLEKLSDRLENLKKLLQVIKPFTDAFMNDFLKPILDYAIPKLKEFWESLNEWVDQIETALSDEELWQDLTTVFQFIYDILVPVIKGLLWLADLITTLVTQHIFNDLKTIIADIGDVIGFLAALINGDFSEAWKHLKELLWDNRLQDAKDDVNLLKDAFVKIIDPIKNMATNFKQALTDMIDNWKVNAKKWWDEDVMPWFTKEKWMGIFSNIGESIANAIVGTQGFIEKWKTNISDWWNNDVVPWFTLEKWKSVFKNIGDSLSDSVVGEDGFVTKWKKNISDWWNNDVLVWFTKEKWAELGTNMKDGIVEGFDKVVNGIKGIINKVIDAFQGLVNGAIDMINSIIGGYNKVADSTPGLKSIGTISHIDLSKYKLPLLATGAVLPPNKPFLAMVGDQKHGTNIEAPLQTIVDAMNIALAQNGGAGQPTREEHYYLNETELMSIVYKLVQGGARQQGKSLIKGGAY